MTPAQMQTSEKHLDDLATAYKRGRKDYAEGVPGNLCPKEYVNNIANCLVAMEQDRRQRRTRASTGSGRCAH